MRRATDIRLARVAKAKAPGDLTEARARSLLRAQAAVSALLRAGVFKAGDRAAAVLASLPDTPALRTADEARLARDHAGVEQAFEAQLLRLLPQYHEGRALAPCEASPADLLAASLAESRVRIG
jgi:hypothetical protein